MPKKPGPKTEPHLDELRRRTLTLDDSTWRILLVLGRGNASRGVRAAARAEYRRYQMTPDPSPSSSNAPGAEPAAG